MARHHLDLLTEKTITYNIILKNKLTSWNIFHILTFTVIAQVVKAAWQWFYNSKSATNELLYNVMLFFMVSLI